MKLLTAKNIFYISPITVEDLGRYKCVSENSFGAASRDLILFKSNEKSLDFLIYGYVESQAPYNASKLGLLKSTDLNKKPVHQKLTKSSKESANHEFKIANLFDRLTLNCPLVYDDHIQWFKNNILLLDSTNASYSISNLQKNDFTKYTCRSSTNEFHITVLKSGF